MSFQEVGQRQKIENILSKLRKFSFWISFSAVGMIIYDLGFKHSSVTDSHLTIFYLLTLLLGIITIVARTIIKKSNILLKVRIFDAIILSLFIILFLIKTDLVGEEVPFLSFFNNMGWVYIAVITYFIR